MPRRPTFLLLSVLSETLSEVPSSAAESVCVEVDVPLGRGSERCWMMVLLTANLYLLEFSGVDDSDIRDWRILFCRGGQ